MYDSTEPATKAEWAIWSARRGRRVFPVRPSCKEPLIKDWPTHATTNETQIGEWWTRWPEANIGVACGDGLLVLDLDVKGDKDGINAALEVFDLEVFHTFTVRTPSGGRHLYFNGPDVPNSAGRLAAGIDVRSKRGFVVGPGSTIPGGRFGAYEIIERVPVASAPAEVLAAVRRSARTSSQGLSCDRRVDLDGPDAVHRARVFLDVDARLAVQGRGGDHTTFTVAAKLKDFGVSEVTAFELMLDHWNERCSPPWLHDELWAKIGNAYRYSENPAGSDHPAVHFAGVDVEAPPLLPASRFTAAQLSQMDFPPVRWVVPGILPEGVTLLAGKAKLGKSWWMLDLACAVAAASATLGRECEGGDVLYAALEDNPRRLKSRLATLFPFSDWPDRLTLWTEMPRLADGGLGQIRAWIAQAVDPKVIIIDVLARIRAPRRAEESNYDADYRSVADLKALADELGIAVLLVHHLRKASSDDPLDEVSGTTGLTGAVDTVLVLRRDERGTVLYGRGRDIEEFDTAVEFDRVACRWRLLGSAESVRRSEERAAIVRALSEADEAMSPKDLSDASGLPHVNVRKLLGKMVKAGEIQKSGRGRYRVICERDHIGHEITSSPPAIAS